jgi:hypothetical protein
MAVQRPLVLAKCLPRVAESFGSNGYIRVHSSHSSRVRNLAGREPSLELIIMAGRPYFDCLTIVIPALNEEGAIGGIIARCQAASETIMKASGLLGIERSSW